MPYVEGGLKEKSAVVHEGLRSRRTPKPWRSWRPGGSWGWEWGGWTSTSWPVDAEGCPPPIPGSRPLASQISRPGSSSRGVPDPTGSARAPGARPGADSPT
jgi:hypothetical protein